MFVYREFDQQQLDAQYNCRGMVADFDDHIQAWISESAQARDTLECRLDVAYGSGEDERLDIFPAAPAAAPVLVFIHGGYWRAMDKAEHSFPALGLVPAGVAVVSVNYSLAPSVRMSEIVRQCREAVAWTWRNAASFGGDPDRIHVCGHSAGGHLTAMMMATDWPEFSGDLPTGLVRGGAPVSGLYDLEPIRWSYLNADVRLDSEDIARFSPVRLSPQGARWMVITAGGLESAEFHRLQEDLVAAWGQRGLETQVVDSPGRHHFDVVRQLADRDSPLTRAIVARILD